MITCYFNNIHEEKLAVKISGTLIITATLETLETGCLYQEPIMLKVP